MLPNDGQGIGERNTAHTGWALSPTCPLMIGPLGEVTTRSAAPSSGCSQGPFMLSGFSPTSQYTEYEIHSSALKRSHQIKKENTNREFVLHSGKFYNVFNVKDFKTIQVTETLVTAQQKVWILLIFLLLRHGINQITYLNSYFLIQKQDQVGYIGVC